MYTEVQLAWIWLNYGILLWVVRMPIKRDLLIQKQNILAKIRSNSMSLQELQLFSVYLAKIDVHHMTTRVVRLSLIEFRRIMKLGELNFSKLQNTVDSLLNKMISVPLERGGFERVQLFKECRIGIDEKDEWYMEIDAHDKALPLMFEFKGRYFTYELWNTRCLKSANQIRMYEILKQYEFIGEQVFTVHELRDQLGIDNEEYPRFNSFRERVIDACQKALETYTDICFNYTPYGSRGKGGKINALKFTIRHNDNHIDQLLLAEFIDQSEIIENMPID